MVVIFEISEEDVALIVEDAHNFRYKLGRITVILPSF